MGVIAPGASGPNNYGMRFATGASTDRLSLPDRTESAVTDLLRGDVTGSGALDIASEFFDKARRFLDALVRALGGNFQPLIDLVEESVSLPDWLGDISGWNPLSDIIAFLQSLVQTIIDGVFNGFANMGEMLDFTRPITDVIDTIAGLLGLGLNNQSMVSTLEAEVRLLKSEGNTISDNFERASNNVLGNSWHQMHAWGGGGGTIGTDGKGNAVWKTSGGSTRGDVCRHLTAGSATKIATDSCVVSTVLASDPPDAGSPGAFLYLGFSVHESAATYGRLRIGRNKVAIERVNAGAVTVLAEQTIHPRAGQTLELQRGESGNTNMHKYVLKRNGTVVWEWTDSGSSIPFGAAYRSLAFGMQAASRQIVPIFLYEQWLPAAAGVISLREVL